MHYFVDLVDIVDFTVVYDTQYISQAYMIYITHLPGIHDAMYSVYIVHISQAYNNHTDNDINEIMIPLFE